MKSLECWMNAAVLILSLGACSDSETMGVGDAAMHDALADGQVENQRHAEACDAAPSMLDMANEVDRHADSMDGIMERMDGVHHGMGAGRMGSGMRHCTGAGFEHMSGTLDDMHSALSDHVARMRATSELDAARFQCRTHTETMAEMMRSMTGDLESTSCMAR